MKRQVKHVSDDQVKAACIAYRERRFDGRFVDSYLAELADVPLKVAQRKLEQCADKGLINYGVSLRSGWWEGD